MQREFRSSAAALLLVVLLAACSGPPAGDRSFHAWFQALRERVDEGDGSWQAVDAGYLAALPIVRIELKRSQAYDFTSLEIVFLGGERASKRGGMADWPSGTRETLAAEVPFHEYARLCWLIESLDLPRASASWSVQVSHREQRSVSWTTRDGRTVELSDDGDAGPPAVVALATAIENAARRLEWAPAGAAEGDG
ncbi:MAG: hypothetical protein ACYTG2_10560 [Planctomycetota bacterium]